MGFLLFQHRMGLGLLVTVLLAGCGQKAAEPVKPGPRKVVLQTDWFPQAEHGGFYQALAKGYYTHAGLDVEIRPGGPGVGIKLGVARGDADFGMNRSDDIMINAARGMPLVIVAATFQRDAEAVMVHADSPVKTLKDLNGRVVIASVSMTWIPYVQKKHGIKFDLKPNTYGLGEFLANPETIQQCIVTSEPFVARQNGKAVRTLALADEGYEPYSTIFCRRDLVSGSPEVVRAFVAASIRGWRDYLSNDPAPADAIIRQRNPQMSAELLEFSRGEMILRGLVQGDPARGEDVGRISMARLFREMETLRSLGILDTPLAIAQVATDDFLPPAGR